MQKVVVEDSVLSDSIFLLGLQGFNAPLQTPSRSHKSPGKEESLQLDDSNLNKTERSTNCHILTQKGL